MKKLAFGALLVGLLVACGGGGDSNNKIVLPDADVPMVCDVRAQTGCGPTEKCTWILDALMPQYVGHIGCVPDGTKNADEACMFGAAGATGYDDCKKGFVCGNYRGGAGTCKQICDQQGGTPACDAQHVCVTYSGLFSTGDTTPPAGGVCDLACDPLLDNDFDGSQGTLTGSGSARRANTCGSNANVGCYGYPSFGSPPKTGWSCTNDINNAEAQPIGLRHRVQCIEGNNCAEPGPQFYVNSCNQGYLPLLRDSSTISTAICVAMCKPLPCYTGNCGTNNIARHGAAGDSCRTGDRVIKNGIAWEDYNGGSNDPDGGEHCTHLWFFEIDDMGALLTSPTSDEVGFCYNHQLFQYDANGNGTIEANDPGYPNCGLLGSGEGPGSDPTMPLTYWGALDLGCVPTTFIPPGANGKKHLPDSFFERRAKMDLPRALYRRTMGTR